MQPSNLKNALILVIDDSKQNAKLISKKLAALGYQNTIAKSGVQALQHIQTVPPDLILLDLMKPNLDGLEICQQLKTNPLSARIPVIFMTSSRDTHQLLQAFDKGADDYIVKPFRSEELLVRIETQLANRRLQQQLAAQNQQLQREIEVRKAAEERSKILERAIAASSNGIIITDALAPNNGIIYANSGFERLTGYSAAEMIGRNCRSLQGSDTDPAALAKIRSAVVSGTNCQVILKNYRKDGTSFWNELNISPVRDATGKIVHYIGVQTDVTDRLAMEAALKQSQLSLVQAQKLAHLGIWEFFPGSRTFSWSEETFAIFGLKTGSKEPNYEEFLELIHPEDRQAIKRHFREILAKGNSYNFECRIIRNKSQIRYLEARGEVVFSSDGKLVKLLGTLLDISDRKQVEISLREKEQFLRSVYDGVEQLIFVIDVLKNGDFCYVDANPAHQKFTGISSEKLSGKTPLEVFPPETAEKILQNYQTCLALEKTLTYEEYFPCYGHDNWWVTSLKPLRDEEGKIYRIVGTSIDITERKKVEAELATQQKFLRQVIDVVPSSIFVKDEEGKFLIVNQQAAATYGREVEEMLGKKDEDFNKDMTQIQKFRATNREVMQSRKPKVIPTEVLKTRKDENRWYRTVISPFVDTEGQVRGIIGSSTDITDVKLVEEELRVSKEAAEAANRAKSAFLANMSHELRTPLNAILGFSQLLNNDRNLNSQQRDYVKIINRSGEHLLGLIDDILDLSKIEAGRVTVNNIDFDLRHLLSEIEEMFQLKTKAKKLNLLFEIEDKVPQAICSDRLKLRQILINLLSNAIKFTDQGQVTLRVKVNPEKEEKDLTAIRLSFEVEDTGVGMDSEEVGNLFNPFVQAKAGIKAGEGTGLGLAISRKYVQFLGGDLTVTSELGRGSIFGFTMKGNVARTTPSLSGTSNRRPIALAPNQLRYRILIVDDRWNNRQLLVQMLSPLGFEVREAANGQEAIEIWEQFQPHLICMDMQMPIMDGYEASHRIKSTVKGRSMPIIALTASAFAEQKSSILAAGCDDILSKPFQEQELFDKLAHYLGVQYLYLQEESEINAKNDNLVNPLIEEIDFPKVSPQWIEEMQQAVRCADGELMEHLTNQIQSVSSEFAGVLHHLIYNFDYFKIQELLTQMEELNQSESN